MKSIGPPSRGGAAVDPFWSTTSLRLRFPARGDLLAFFARHPHHHRFRAGRSGFVPYRIGRLHVSRHAGLEDVTLSIHHMVELARDDVEHLDRAMLVIT